MIDNKARERQVEACLAQRMPEVDMREFSIVGNGDDAMLRVVVDHPDGVDHDLCEAVTHALQADGLGDDFGIEVWSPGPEPAMRVRRHYQEAVGHRIRIKVSEKGRNRNREGVLEAVTDEGIRLAMQAGTREFAFAAIRKGCVLDAEWEPAG